MSEVHLLRLLQLGFVGRPALLCGGLLRVVGVSLLGDCVSVVCRSHMRYGLRLSTRSFSIIDGQWF